MASVPIHALLVLATALGCGLAMGAEREWHRRAAGMRTCGLVALGAALFVLVNHLSPSEQDSTRIAGQVVTGVGFLGAGVIMRSGLNIRGLNTAATIWCASAVGTIAASGSISLAIVGTILVLALHMSLRPLERMLAGTDQIHSGEHRYQLQVTCARAAEPHVRSLMVELTNVPSMQLEELRSQISDTKTQVALTATLGSPDPQTTQVEQIIRRLGLEHDLSDITWRALTSAQGD